MLSLISYIEISLSILLLLSFSILLWLRNLNLNGLPWNWPVLGMLPSVLFHAHRVHDRCVDLLELSGGTFLIKGPWLADMDILATSDPANVHFVMSSNFSNFPKGPEFKKIFDLLGHGIFNSDNEAWSSQRRRARALITHDRFRKFLVETTHEKIAGGLVPVLDRATERGVTVDLQDVFQRFTFDTTCELVTGFDPGCLSVELPEVPFSRAMDEAEEAIFVRHILPEAMWRVGKWARVGHERRLSRARFVLDDVIGKYVSMRREELKKSDGGLDLLTSYIKGEEFGDDRFLRDTVLNFMIAGRDTTSSALTWFVWLVSKHPEIERKIRDELSSVVVTEKKTGERKLFRVEELNNLVFLHAALCECLRLYPPVPFQHKAPVREVILPSGHHVGPKMKVLFSLYAMGRMDRVWGEDSKEFKPERWISERGTIKYEASYKFPAFNAGPRTCLGKEVAFTQLKCVAAAIIHNYEIRVVEGHVVSPNVSVILYMKHGLKVRVSKRKIDY